MQRNALGLIRLWAAFILLRLAGVLTDMAARMAPGWPIAVSSGR